MPELSDLDATAQAELVRNGDVSPSELVDDAISRIEKLNPELNAVIHPLFDKAREQARGELPDGPFKGVPMVLKDLDGHTAGDPYHFGNKALKAINYVPDFDSYSHAKLRDAGFVFVGKTNCPELGLLPTTEPEAYGPTRNPWNTEHSPGGSSGGTAAAVASRMVPVGTAGDGGGSIRIPSSECGLVGLKPTRGRVSFGPDLGEVWKGLVVRGALARSVRDSAAVLDVMSGQMPGDPYTAPRLDRPLAEEVGADPGRLRIGVTTDAPEHLTAVDPICAQAAGDVAALLSELGHHVSEESPASLDDPQLVADGTVLLSSWINWELTDLGRMIGRDLVEDDVEPTTWAFARMADDIKVADYIGATERLDAAARTAAQWWANDFDLLLTPTLPMTPPKLGTFDSPPDNPLHGVLVAASLIAFVVPFNISGQPAISLPLHWTEDGLPVGVQLVAAQGREDLLVRIAAQLEEARPWADRRPPIS
jgi:amidase